jgi:hypothetical protein
MPRLVATVSSAQTRRASNCALLGKPTIAFLGTDKRQMYCGARSDLLAHRRRGCSRGLSVFEVAGTDFHARLHSYPGATRRAPGNELCTVVAIAQGMDHALQDPERA